MHPGMPELPEVEVTRRRIAPLLVGRRVRRVRASAPSYLFLTPPGRVTSTSGSSGMPGCI